jgi:phosphoglucosamine mutase
MSMKSNLFGTDGIRRAVGNSPFTLQELPQLGIAIAQWIQEQYTTTKNPTVFLGYDPRSSAHFVKAALQSGLLLSSLTIYDSGVVPTPAAYAFTYKKKWFHCGLILSASHNPFQDNGIKIFDQEHGKIQVTDEERIGALLAAVPTTYPDYTQFGSVNLTFQAAQEYCEILKEHFTPHFLQRKKIVLDCAHGATSFVAPFIFTYYGATVIVINNQPNGSNINAECGALYPAPLKKTVLEQKADIGFAFDGDGDRLLVVTKEGHIKDGDDILAVLLKHPLYASTKTVASTIMSNYGFEEYLRQSGRCLIRTSVGDKYVARALATHQIPLGGEPSGHIIMRDYLDTGDGIFTALRLLEAIDIHNDWNMVTFNKYPQIHFALTAPIKKDLAQVPLAQVIQEHEGRLENGRLIVRYSGTENILRVMLEDKNEQHARTVGLSLTQQLQEILMEPSCQP